MWPGGVRDRWRGGNKKPVVDDIDTPIRSSGDLPDQTAKQIRDNHVAQEPSDPPAPHRSKALDQPRVDQPDSHSVAELPPVVYHRPPVQSPPMPTVSYAAATIVPPSVPIHNHLSVLSLLPTIVDVGPWGGGGGSSWDDGVYDGVRQIKICAGQCIDSITVVYDKNGQSVSAERHGGGGGSPSEFTLRYPEEYLVHVSGHYAPFLNISANPLIRSLKFKTNKGASYGPYGTKTGKSFNLPIQRGRIVGFMGRSGLALDSIAFHIS